MVSTSWHTPDTGERPREPRVSVVVPALNEARNLREVLPTLPDVHEVILVDGGSVDGTVEAAREALPGIITVAQTGAGKGNALAAGLARATGDVVVMFDADGSGDPRQMPSFVAALVAGADFAKGSRSGPRAGRFLHTWMNRSFRTRLTDRCHGYNALWADVVPLLDLPGHEGHGRQIETLMTCRVAHAGLSITEVPGVDRSRRDARSQVRALSDGWRVLRTIRSERARLRQRHG